MVDRRAVLKLMAQVEAIERARSPQEGTFAYVYRQILAAGGQRTGDVIAGRG